MIIDSFAHFSIILPAIDIISMSLDMRKVSFIAFFNTHSFNKKLDQPLVRKVS